MSYARARLWLGICAAGSLVVLATIMLATGIPSQRFSQLQTPSGSAMGQLFLLTFLVGMWLAPLDFLGGFYLPRKFHKSFFSFRFWFKRYLLATLGQAFLFSGSAWLILLAGQTYGWFGAAAVVPVLGWCFFALRNRLISAKRLNGSGLVSRLGPAMDLVRRWNITPVPTIVVSHRDLGFTGGIIGVGKSARIVIPRAWLKTLSREELATAISRRSVAVNSGSYLRGLLLAFGWNVTGFLMASWLPNAGLETVGQLATTVCGFTIWSFLGLLTLPTLSRNASLEIDDQLRGSGVPANLIWDTAYSQDQLQDGEPHRSKWIERVFHPIPSVSQRNRSRPRGRLAAWNVAHTTLFLSWSCFGVLSRAVHCNIGRPELWTMLPTD